YAVKPGCLQSRTRRFRIKRMHSWRLKEHLTTYGGLLFARAKEVRALIRGRKLVALSLARRRVFSAKRATPTRREFSETFRIGQRRRRSMPGSSMPSATLYIWRR